MREAIRRLNRDPVVIERHSENIHDDKELKLEGTQLRDVLLKSFSMPEELRPRSTHLQDPEDRHYLSHEQLEHESRLKDVLGRPEVNGAFSENQLIQSWARRYRSPNPVVVEGDPPLDHLNASQIRAMAMMIGERMSLIQGPPGTGKTKTIVEAIKLLKGHFEVPHPILVCTYTNVAVDNLLEGFAAGGLKPLRVGTEGLTKDELEKYLFDNKFEEHPRKSELDRLVAEYEALDLETRRLWGIMAELKAEKKPNGWRETLGESRRVKRPSCI